MNSEHDQQSPPHSTDGYIQPLADEWLEIPDRLDPPIFSAVSERRPSQRQQSRRPSEQPSNPKGLIRSGLARSQRLTEAMIQAKVTVAQPTGISDIAGEQGYNRHFYHSRSMTTPWWIILSAWVIFGLPTLLFSIQQLSQLLQAAHASLETPMGETISATMGMRLPLAIASITATSIVFYILGRQTARRIRSDRRQARFRHYHKERESLTGHET
jgi:hypothetical protein